MRSMLLVYFLVACGDPVAVEEQAPSPLTIQGLVERGWLEEWPADANGISCRVVAPGPGTLQFRLADRDPPATTGKPGSESGMQRSGMPLPRAANSPFAAAGTELINLGIPVRGGDPVTMRWAWWRTPDAEKPGRMRLLLEQKTASAEAMADIPVECLPPQAGWSVTISGGYAGAPIERAVDRTWGLCETSWSTTGNLSLKGDSAGFTQIVELNGIEFPTARAPWPLWALSVRFEPAQ